jgi:hypothetical protein
MNVLSSLTSLVNLRRTRKTMGWRRPKAAFLIEALETRLLLSADLSVHETGLPSVHAAGTVSYNVTLTNLGPGPAALAETDRFFSGEDALGSPWPESFDE